jgi:predicted acetyltransferase
MRFVKNKRSMQTRKRKAQLEDGKAILKKQKLKPDELKLVQAEKKDLIEICRLLLELEQPDDPESDSGFLNNLGVIYNMVSARKCWLFAMPSALAGFACVSISDWESDAVQFEIAIFFIAVPFRRCGLGRRAVDLLIAKAKSQDADIVYCQPVEQRAAWLFWRANGFQFSHGVDCLVDEKEAKEMDDRIASYRAPGGNVHLQLRLKPVRTEPFPPDRSADGSYYCRSCDLFWPPENFEPSELFRSQKRRRCKQHA